MLTGIDILLKVIEQKLDWGESGSWQSRDFEKLNQRILEETGVSLSASTLRRIWGRVEYKHLPSSTTLDTLAKFAGYESWRMFLKHQNTQNTSAAQPAENITAAPGKRNMPWLRVAWGLAMLILAGLAGVIAFKKPAGKTKTAGYSFSCKPVSRAIPNSVVFTYDASAAPTDSVYIQQSWDPRTKTLVNKNLHKQTSIYYEPGFYHAKLLAGGQVVQEHPLLIPTDGWLGIITNKPVPVYLQPGTFMHPDSMQVPVQAIEKKNIFMEVSPPWVKYYNVGNFEPVALEDFNFSAEVKNEYNQGAAACQFTGVDLITDDGPVLMQLSTTGCVSELNLINAGQMVSGKKTDLSGFGADFSKWVTVSCEGSAGGLKYYINGKLAYESNLPVKGVKIVGIGFMFQGTGAVKNISLANKFKTIFQAFAPKI